MGIKDNKKVIKAKPRSKYLVTLNINGKDYKSSGDDLFSCVNSIKKPSELLIYNAKPFITVKRGKLEATTTLNKPQINRFFGKEYIRSCFVKNLEMVLKYE